MNVLVTGISGFVGSRLAPRLARDGHLVRGLARDPARVHGEAPVLRGDVVSGAGLAEALDGIDVAYYLVHSMEAGTNGAFAQRDRTAARNFARVARAAGVERIVYLGGLLPAQVAPSPHLASRLEVEQALLEAAPASVALRASIVIGAGSRSFRFLVRLIERLPVLALPPWRTKRTQPVDERDMIEALARCATVTSARGALDLGGPDVVSYGELIERIRDHLILGRPTLGLGFALTPVASRVAAALAGEDPSLIEPLMGSLGEDLLVRDDRAVELLGLRMHSLDRAIEHALGEWEAVEPLAGR